MGVRIAIRDTRFSSESQLYNWNIKKGSNYRLNEMVDKRLLHSGTHAASLDKSLAEYEKIVNNFYELNERKYNEDFGGERHKAIDKFEKFAQDDGWFITKAENETEMAYRYLLFERMCHKKPTYEQMIYMHLLKEMKAEGGHVRKA